MFVIDMLFLAPVLIVIAYVISRAVSMAWHKSKYNAMREMLKRFEDKH